MSNADEKAYEAQDTWCDSHSQGKGIEDARDIVNNQ